MLVDYGHNVAARAMGQMAVSVRDGKLVTVAISYPLHTVTITTYGDQLSCVSAPHGSVDPAGAGCGQGK